MQQPKLFLGFPADLLFTSQIDPTVKGRYLEYLQEIDHQNTPYLGKFLSETVRFEEIEQMKAHIASILKTMAPDFHWDEAVFYLLSIV